MLAEQFCDGSILRCIIFFIPGLPSSGGNVDVIYESLVQCGQSRLTDLLQPGKDPWQVFVAGEENIDLQDEKILTSLIFDNEAACTVQG